MFTIVGRAYLLDNYINLSNRVSFKTLVCASMQDFHYDQMKNKELEVEPWNLLTMVEFCLQDILV